MTKVQKLLHEQIQAIRVEGDPLPDENSAQKECDLLLAVYSACHIIRFYMSHAERRAEIQKEWEAVSNELEKFKKLLER
jgi:organic hydroperoxide reductase OsmC/OhrA